MDRRKMSESQLAYETKRAAKAGLSLERWLERKEKAAGAPAEQAPATKSRAPSPDPKAKAGFLARLLERAQRPL